MHDGDAAQAKERVWKGEMCIGLLSTKGWRSRRSRLKISPMGIAISSPLGDYWLPGDNVLFITSAGFFPWLWMGLGFHHDHLGFPGTIKFVSAGQGADILAHAQACGYPVRRRRKQTTEPD